MLSINAYSAAGKLDAMPKSAWTPIGFGKMIFQIFESYGWGAYFYSVLLLSAPVGMFNLLPLLPLDGGRGVLFVLHAFMSWETAEFAYRTVLGVIGVLCFIGAIRDLLRAKRT